MQNEENRVAASNYLRTRVVTRSRAKRELDDTLSEDLEKMSLYKESEESVNFKERLNSIFNDKPIKDFE